MKNMAFLSLIALTTVVQSCMREVEFCGQVVATDANKLQCTDHRINSIAPLADLEDLDALSLAAVQVEDLAPLAGLASLKDLNLSGASAVTDLSLLTRLKVLSNKELSS